MSNKYNPSKFEDEEFIPGEIPTQNKNSQSALNQYKTGTELENIYNSAIGELENNREADKRSAYYNNEKLMKYLPNAMKVQGLQNNVGAMNQAYIDANNAYQNNLNSINREYNSQKTELTNDLNIQKYQEQKDLSSKLLGNRLDNLSVYASQFDVNEKGQYSTDDLNKIKSYADTLSEGLTDADKQLLSEGLSQYMGMSKEDEENYSQNLKESQSKELAVSDYGISSDEVGINASNADVYSFGKFAGTGNGTEQDSYLQLILDASRRGGFKNGDVVDVNYGAGKASNYIYIDGYWYKTNRKANYSWKNASDIQYLTAPNTPRGPMHKGR